MLSLDHEAICESDRFDSVEEVTALHFARIAADSECLYGDPMRLPFSSGATIGLDSQKLKVISDNPNMRYEQSFDASIFSVLNEWQFWANEEEAGRIPGVTYRSVLISESVFYRLFEPTGDNTRGVIVSNNFNPIHSAWQCPQNPNATRPDGRVKINYQLTDGSCRTCNPALITFRSADGLVNADTCEEI